MRKSSNHFSKTKAIAWLLGFFLLSGCMGSEDTIPVNIVSQGDSSVVHSFKAELADDARERAMGLMFRRELAPDHGMLFIFPEDTETSFWMKDTLVSLDIIFIGADKKIISISERAEPQTTTPRVSERPYRYVLEIPGGRCDELGIQAGDSVEFTLP
jgi:uncharacterized membrane protein (UPF0127 family)